MHRFVTSQALVSCLVWQNELSSWVHLTLEDSSLQTVNWQFSTKVWKLLHKAFFLLSAGTILQLDWHKGQRMKESLHWLEFLSGSVSWLPVNSHGTRTIMSNHGEFLHDCYDFHFSFYPCWFCPHHNGLGCSFPKKLVFPPTFLDLLANSLSMFLLCRTSPSIHSRPLFLFSAMLRWYICGMSWWVVAGK